MNFTEYQKAVTRTIPRGRTYEQNASNFAMGLAGEVGKLWTI